MIEINTLRGFPKQGIDIGQGYASDSWYRPHLIATISAMPGKDIPTDNKLNFGLNATRKSEAHFQLQF